LGASPFLSETSYFGAKYFPRFSFREVFFSPGELFSSYFKALILLPPPVKKSFYKGPPPKSVRKKRGHLKGGKPKDQ